MIQNKLALALCALTIFSIRGVFAQTDASTTTIDWSNDGNTLVKDENNVALSTGAAGNSNGALIQIGYYDGATSANQFLGTWVPLTGAGPALTTIGDSPDGNDLAAGRFGFTTTFHFTTNSGNNKPVDVFDSSFDTAAYTTMSSIPITSTAPPSSQILSIRIYNVGETRFNAVSNNNWMWQTPTDAGTNLPAISLTQAGIVWEDSAHPFQTFLFTAVPEPSSIVLLALGTGALAFGYRRRRSKA
jgi:hypothetical protein